MRIIMNNEYFDLLLKMKDKSPEPMSLFCSKSNEGGIFTPFCLLDENKVKAQPVFLYESLRDHNSEIFKGHDLRLIKMQAGLGSSVKRDDIIMKYDNRESLGSKGTDLFFPVGENNFKSVVSLQVLQANYLKNYLPFSKVKLQFLVNEETSKQVASCIDSLDTSIKKVMEPEISQNMMPTISEAGELTRERVAPAGHGFIGFREIYQALSSEADEIVCIGNGEDLNSTPDEKILAHVIKNEIPVVMITTTKTSADLKGGQMGIRKEGEHEIISIFEKAQAEESGQLEYFEKLGLREQDGESFFNTNMAIINTKPLRDAFRGLDMSFEDFIEKIAPEVIKNVKIQDGKRFTQLESALGSVLLNMNSFFIKKSGRNILHLCNVGVENRYRFFLPIKKREDYDFYLEKYKVTTPQYTLNPKG